MSNIYDMLVIGAARNVPASQVLHEALNNSDDLPRLLKGSETGEQLVDTKSPVVYIGSYTEECREILCGDVQSMHPRMSLSESFSRRSYILISVKDSAGPPPPGATSAVMLFLERVSGVSECDVSVNSAGDTVRLFFRTSYEMDPVAISAALLILRLATVMHSMYKTPEKTLAEHIAFCGTYDAVSNYLLSEFLSKSNSYASALGGSFYGGSRRQIAKAILYTRIANYGITTGSRGASLGTNGDGPSSKIDVISIAYAKMRNIASNLSDTLLGELSIIPSIQDYSNPSISFPIFEEMKRRTK